MNTFVDSTNTKTDTSFVIEGNTGMPSILGGYLLFKMDGREIHIASVPSPNLYADRYTESVVDNHDDFEDFEGNQYDVDVFSSNVGVDWSIKITPMISSMITPMNGKSEADLKLQDDGNLSNDGNVSNIVPNVNIASNIKSRLQVEFLRNEY